MPELPEVETTLRGITPFVDKQKIKTINIYNASLRWPIDQLIANELKNKVVLNTARRAKYLLLHFKNGTLIMHLGMSGSMHIVEQKTPLQKHDHFELVFCNGKSLRLRDPRRFGAVLWTSDDWQEHKLLKSLGPEPFDENFTGEYLHKLSRKKSISIKSFIMDGHIVVGVGNIYASESLFLAGIHPTQAAKKISLNRFNTLVKSIKSILQQAIEKGGTTLKDFNTPEGKPGYFAQKLQVYGRKDLPCTICQHPIKHRVINQRATYYCTHCQK